MRSRTPRILLVEDDEDARETLSTWLAVGPWSVATAVSGEEALAKMSSFRPDLLLLDVGPDGDGFEVARRLRAHARWRTVPIIFLTAGSRPEDKILGFAAGGDDSITKPFRLEEIDARIEAMLRKRQLYLRLEAANRDLRFSNRRLERLLITDEKTGLANCRHFRQRLDEEFRRAERYETPLSVLMMDLDSFKAINDAHGHAEGDRVLREVGALLRETGRTTDLVARYGGEEFAALLPSTPGRRSLRVAERFRAAVASTFRAVAGRPSVTLSVGVATWHPGSFVACPEELLERADRALHQAKTAGKNRVALDASSAVRALPRPISASIH